MKFVAPQGMTRRQEEALGLCLASGEGAASRQEVLRILPLQIAALEKGLTLVRSSVPVPRGGEIDLLAADASGRPVLLFVEEELDAAAIGRACVCAEWVEENREPLGHFTDGRISCGPARVWHLASAVAPGAEALVRRMEGASTRILVHRLLSLPAGWWLVALPHGEVRGRRGRTEEVAARAPEFARAPSAPIRAFRSVLTEEEIEDFYGFSATEPDGSGVASRAEIVARMS